VPDSLASFIDSLRHRLEHGELPAEHRDETEQCLWEVDFFRQADRWKEHPEPWRSIRYRLRARLRALQRVL